jgi:hypothetical protein
VATQQVADLAARGGQADEQVLGGDVLVAHLGGELLGRLHRGERLPGQLRRAHRGTGRRRQPVAELGELGTHGRGIGAHRGQQRRGDPVGLGQQRAQQVRRPHVGVAGERRRLRSGRDRLLRLGGGVEGIHPLGSSCTWIVRAPSCPVEKNNVRKVERVPLKELSRSLFRDTRRRCLTTYS